MTLDVEPEACSSYMACDTCEARRALTRLLWSGYSYSNYKIITADVKRDSQLNNMIGPVPMDGSCHLISSIKGSMLVLLYCQQIGVIKAYACPRAGQLLYARGRRRRGLADAPQNPKVCPSNYRPPEQHYFTR